MGNSSATYALYVCYELGDGVSENNCEVFRLFQRASEMGDLSAYTTLVYVMRMVMMLRRMITRNSGKGWIKQIGECIYSQKWFISIDLVPSSFLELFGPD